MGRIEKMRERIEKLKSKPDYIRNMGIVAHIDHGKTTLSDNLLYGAGMISKDTAGKQLALDFHEDEQQRGITINAANVSLIHEYKGDNYLINMIDTPGHVDFGGDVTRAMRAVDGVVVVACAVEGVMPQTKTVLNQALRENVRPTLFINKVDRLINELQLTPEELQKRLIKIITEVNKIIVQRQPAGLDWQVNVANGSVAFGSAFNNWAISIPFMKSSGITFKNIIDYCNNDEQRELADRAPAFRVVLDMAIEHLPNPKVAQKIRIPKIWHGDLESKIGQDMINCNPEGKLAMMVTNITTFDKREGEVATGRLFSGTLRHGDEVYLVGAKSKEKVQQVGVYMGATRLVTEYAPPGNIIGVTGLKRAFTGETAASENIEPFEEIRYVSEPVVTKAVEPQSIKDLAKMIEILKQVAKEDPSLAVKIDEESGEYLISGMGELHLEIVENRINDGAVKIKTSPPIVVYRESVDGKSQQIEGKSPNKHNKFYIYVEKLEEKIYDAIVAGEIPSGRYKSRSKDIRQQLVDLEFDKEEAKRIIDIYHGNVMVDMTKGVIHLDEVMELLLDGFEQVMSTGPMSSEPMIKVKVVLMDAKLHEDAIHRGPAQIYPAVRRPIQAGILAAKPTMFEPVQNVWVDVPQDFMSPVISELQKRRGQIGEMTQKEDIMEINGVIPISESFGFAGEMRSASEGHAIWSTENAGFHKLPVELQNKVVNQIRQRKGLKAEIPKPEDYME